MSTKVRQIVLGVVVTVFAAGVVTDRLDNPTAGVDCGGPQRVVYSGSSTFQQRNVITCYVHALARGDRSALQHLTEAGYRVGRGDLRMAADAAAGTVRARMGDNKFDEDVSFTFADHRTGYLGLDTQHAFWRLAIGRPS